MEMHFVEGNERHFCLKIKLVIFEKERNENEHRNLKICGKGIWERSLTV